MRRRDTVLICIGLAAMALGVVPAAGGAPGAPVEPGQAQIAAGQAIAERDCSTCHAIGPVGDSPFEGAPRWRDLHDRFDVGDLGESLAEGIVVGHEAMPAKAYEPADVQALIAYLRSLETAP
jgi:mono/diheme cytochrome c family protein